MISPSATCDRMTAVDELAIEDAEIVALKGEINRLSQQLDVAQSRLHERTLDVAKAQNESKRQQARVENAMRWAEERRMEFLRVCAERDSLIAEVERLQAKLV